MNTELTAVLRSQYRQLMTVVASLAIAFPVAGQDIHEFQKIIASDGALGDEFGYSVSLGGGIRHLGRFP